jgi:NodT family efflux transporter outer membrane factor (OMF) lipoprotein
LLCAAALAGCAAVGPDYVERALDSPPSWTSAPATPLPTRSQGRDAEALAAWWSHFSDPVLDGLIADALSANLELAAAQARLREARARRALAAAQLGPTVSASASATGGRASAESGSGSHYERYGAGLDARWEADVFGGLRRGVEAADAEVGASVASLRDTQVTLAAEVALNYVDLRLAERRVAVAEASLAARRETFDIVRWRSQAGLVSELDVAQARTDLESTLANLPPFRSAAAEARHRLALLLGRAPGDLRERLASGPAIPIAGEAVALGIPAETLRQRPDVRAAERQVAARTARLGQAMAARYPSFTLSGSVGLEALALSALGSSGAGAVSLLGAVGAPIFDSGRIAANVEIQDALLEQALTAYRAAVLGALGDVENALAALSSAVERRARLAAAAESARATLTIAEQRYASGLSDFLSVLDGQRTLLSLEEQLAGSIGALASAQIQLYKALGGGWSPDSPPIGAKETR